MTLQCPTPAATLAQCEARLWRPRCTAAMEEEHAVSTAAHSPFMYCRQSNLNAKFESELSYSSFKHVVPGAFTMDLISIGSTCTALPSGPECLRLGPIDQTAIAA